MHKWAPGSSKSEAVGVPTAGKIYELQFDGNPSSYLYKHIRKGDADLLGGYIYDMTTGMRNFSRGFRPPEFDEIDVSRLHAKDVECMLEVRISNLTKELSDSEVKEFWGMAQQAVDYFFVGPHNMSFREYCE